MLGSLGPLPEGAEAAAEFTLHWSPVSPPPGFQADHGLYALWPSPANDDLCFRAAGFTSFGDQDAAWDEKADAVLARVIVEFSRLGAPRLLSAALLQRPPWYQRLWRRPQPLDLHQQLCLPMQWDSLPACVVAFGDSGVRLCSGDGHDLLWLRLPPDTAAQLPELLERIRGPHPLQHSPLAWQYLLHDGHPLLAAA